MIEKKGTVTKNVLINQIASKCSLDSKEVGEVINTLQEVLLDNINNNYEVRINGFISFKIIRVAQRVGTNKRTGESIKIESQKRVNAKISDTFQRKIAQKEFYNL